MKTLFIQICALATFCTSSLFADGIPVDPKTGKISVPHTIVKLNADQVEEVDSLGTLTFTSEQWEKLRKGSPGCRKRLREILPVTHNDCTCGVESPYGIALARDKVAVLRDSLSADRLAWVLWRDGTAEDEILRLRTDHRGQFYHEGTLVPFQMLLQAIANQPESVNEERSKDPNAGKPFIYVDCPVGMDREAVTLKSRIDQLYKTAGAAGWETPDSEES